MKSAKQNLAESKLGINLYIQIIKKKIIVQEIFIRTSKKYGSKMKNNRQQIVCGPITTGYTEEGGLERKS